jgi:hypothetical protein
MAVHFLKYSIEGVTGERAIYKRRGENDNDPGFQQKPKKMYIVFDLSASMMRFNGYDGRLDRSLECALRKSLVNLCGGLLCASD